MWRPHSSAGVLGVADPLTVGGMVGSVFAASTAGQLAGSWYAGHRGLLAGTGTLTVGAALIGVAVLTASPAAFLTGAVVAGAGQGLSFRAGLAAVTAGTPPERRGEGTSSYFLALYAAIALPVVAVGTAAQAFGLVPACAGLAAVVTVAAGGVAVRLFRHRLP